ncbi:unnamed protein product [Boreogadus saida]
MGTLHGFVGLLFGLQIVRHAMGFSSGAPVQSCASLLPVHKFFGIDFPPQNSEQPFEVNAIAGEGESIIVTLGSRSSAAQPFRGFMVDVRKSEIDPANGSFVEFGNSTGLTCNGIQDSAVTQKSNIPKTFVQVKWQAQENGSSSLFLRATFVQNATTFWRPVNVSIQTRNSTTQPLTTTTIAGQTSTEQPTTELPSTDQSSTEQPPTQQTITEQTITEQPSTEQPSTELPSTDQPSTDQPTTEQTITEQTTTEQTSTEQQLQNKQVQNNKLQNKQVQNNQLQHQVEQP